MKWLEYFDTMTQVTLSIPDTASSALDVGVAELGSELLLAAAMKLYEVGKLSSGAAAELAGLSKPEFLQRLGDYRVSAFRLSEEEVRRDLANA